MKPVTIDMSRSQAIVQNGLPNLSNSEAARLQTLHDYDILDTPAEAAFDRITRIAKVTADVPIALISLIDKERQWFKSCIGLEQRETSLDVSFCVHTIAHSQTLILPDAKLDPRFTNNALVTAAPFVRFYAGVPLVSPGGVTLGALCVIDTKPREITAMQLSILEDLARITVDAMELRKAATADSLTGALNKRAFAAAAAQEAEKARRGGRPLAVAVLDLDHFKRVNDTFGHAAGDSALAHALATCRKVLRSGDSVGRIGGEEFAILLPDTTTATARDVVERLRKAISSSPIVTRSGSFNVTASFGLTQMAADDTGWSDFVARADAAMYEAKRQGRDRVVCVHALSAGLSSAA